MTADPDQPSALTVAQVAQRLGVRPRTVYRRIAAGRLAATKVGRAWRVPVAALDGACAATEDGAVGREDASAQAHTAYQAAAPSAASETHYRALWENAEDVLYILDLDGRLTDVNQQGERLTGYARADLLGRPILDLIAPADHAVMRDQLARKLAGVPVTAYQVVLRTRAGDERLLEVRSRLLADDAGRPVGIQGSARDVTARAALEAALRESEERLRLAARAADFGTYDDRGPGQVYWSPELLALFGLPLDTRPDEGARTALSLIHPDDRAQWQAARTAARDPAGAGVMAVEHRIVRPDGRVVWVAQSGRILFAGEGAARHPVRAIGIVADITARKVAEAERERLLAREQAALAAARQALAVRDEFLAAVSHDLRTPLTSIRGLAQLLARRLERLAGPPAPPVLAQVAAIEQAARRMAAMVDELLDVSRLEAGQPLALHRTQVDLVALARACAAEHGQTAPEVSIRVTAAVPDVIGRWDAGRLERVLSNLLTNAIKYSSAGGAIVVGVRLAEPDGAWAELTVSDQGVGIPAEDLPQVFERFHRGANVAGRVAGMGLGLAGVRRIVEDHGGTIAVTSTEGAGTTVTVRLPRTVSGATGPATADA